VTTLDALSIVARIYQDGSKVNVSDGDQREAIAILAATDAGELARKVGRLQGFAESAAFDRETGY
jgi:hypothetical protein